MLLELLLDKKNLQIAGIEDSELIATTPCISGGKKAPNCSELAERNLQLVFSCSWSSNGDTVATISRLQILEVHLFCQYSVFRNCPQTSHQDSIARLCHKAEKALLTMRS